MIRLRIRPFVLLGFLLACGNGEGPRDPEGHAPDSVAEILLSARSSDPAERRAAVQALAALGLASERGLEALVRLTVDPDSGVAASARAEIVALGPEAVPPLMRLYERNGVAVRRSIVRILPEFGSVARDALRQAARNDPDADVRRKAERALQMTGGRRESGGG